MPEHPNPPSDGRARQVDEEDSDRTLLTAPLRVFVLSPGRSGSLAFATACAQIENFDAGHETRTGMVGPERLQYPPHHIECDNRLAWMLGRLDLTNDPKSTLYVHLQRNPVKVADSYAARIGNTTSIVEAYAAGVACLRPHSAKRRTYTPAKIASDMVETVNANISHFLSSRPESSMIVRLDDIQHDFEVFWHRVGATGNLNLALESFDTPVNTSEDRISGFRNQTNWTNPAAAVRNVVRMLRGLLELVRSA